MRYLIGTSGWSYRHWKGPFYPKDLPQKAWFDFYSQRFETVELNNSFYRQPDDDVWRSWHDDAPPGFRYAVKANRYLTHMKRFKETGESLQRFFQGARNLKAYLGPVLYQAPANFRRTDVNLERLDHFFAALPAGMKHVIEFRDKSWFVESTWQLLRSHNVALCIQDMPDAESPVVATSSFAYVRLHGPDKAYQGSYGDKALKAWASSINQLGHDNVREAWVFFNNDQAGYAAENASRLRELV